MSRDVLEIAAQMSQQSRHLADVYNDDKVARARGSCNSGKKRSNASRNASSRRSMPAPKSANGPSRWRLEESVVASQLSQLEEQLATALPALGYQLERDDDTVITFADRQAAE